MKYLKIKNNGVLDIRLVALMGGTTKANDEYKIGQFGTGLKYTLAYLIRNNIDFHIYADGEKVDIKTETENIRGEVFNIICINGNRTSITDRMGQEWSAWMIIRELWCNALDEGGAEKEITETHGPTPGSTIFYIQLTQEFNKVLQNWNNYFVHNVQPLCDDSCTAVYPGGNALRIYKNGVLIKEKNQPAVFSYDLKYAAINEMREYNGSLSHPMWEALKNASESTISYFLENITDSHFEAEADWNWFSNFGDNWRKVIGDSKIIYPEALNSLEERGISVDRSSLILVPEPIYKALTKQFKGIGALRVSNQVNEFYETFSQDSENRIKQGLVILESAGYNFSPEIKFTYGVFGDKTKWASVNLDTKEVLISENIADKSLFDVVTTLIEENEHIKTGYQDCSRNFQQHFIDLYAQKLLKLAKIEL